MTRMLSRKGRRWGICDDDDGKEEVVEVDNNNKTIVALGGGGRQKGGFEEPSRIEVGPGNKIRDGSGTDPGRVDYPDLSRLQSCSRPVREQMICRVVSRIGM